MSQQLNRVLATLAVVGLMAATTAMAGETIQVYKSPTCGCCTKWVEHLEAAGLEVEATNVDDLNRIKEKHEIPRHLRSCHTALVGDYIIEGHVPASDIKRLLEQQPDVRGLAVPGMPRGVPGMAGTGGFEVLSFGPAGGTKHYADH